MATKKQPNVVKQGIALANGITLEVRSWGSPILASQRIDARVKGYSSSDIVTNVILKGTFGQGKESGLYLMNLDSEFASPEALGADPLAGVTLDYYAGVNLAGLIGALRMTDLDEANLRRAITETRTAVARAPSISNALEKEASHEQAN